MCGIAGIFAYRESAPPVDEQELLRIREAMIHRGPDGAGLWISPDRRVGLAHRRLSIIDLSATGAQPMATADGRYRISFNGEIYNYRELKKELEAKGYRFQSKSDTEVLLYLYAEHGAEIAHRLRGMYAFAIWDEAKRELFLARDPFGIKPLYYADDGSTMRVASQVKALLKSGKINAAPEPAGHVGFHLWGYVPEPYTLYKAIRALPPGTSLCIDTKGRSEARQFFSITNELREPREASPVITRDEMQERLHTALLDSVRHHLIADVPVGVFLSSGLDSTTITALAREARSGALHTITLGFKEFQGTPDDEVPLAELVGKRYDTFQHTRWVSNEDFQNEYARVLTAMDQPSTDGVNSYFVSQSASQAGLKVALSGLGGDELFGGYPSFKQLPLAVKTLGHLGAVPSLGRGFRYFSASTLKHFTSPKYAGLFEYGGSYGGAYLLRRGMFMPWELPELLDGELVSQGWQELQTLLRLQQTTEGIDNSHLKVMALENAWYMRNQLLRDADWASMAHSLELRVPFVDIELFRALIPLLHSNCAPDKAAMAATPATPLPSQVLGRQKTGFSLPMREWLNATPGHDGRDASIRGWAKQVFRHATRKKRVLISTLLPGGGGGVATMTKQVVDYVREDGYDVTLACYVPYRLAPDLSVPFWRLLTRSPTSRVSVGFGDIPCYEIGVYLPELEFVRCFPSRIWKDIARRFDYHLAVSGSVHAALPILLQKMPCLAWVATPYRPDKIDRVKNYPWYRRIVDQILDTPICQLLEIRGLTESRVLALSNYTASALRKISPGTRIERMSMPIDAKRFSPRPGDVITGYIGFSGRLSDPRKNIKLLIDAVFLCRSRGFNITVGLAGNCDDAALTDYVERRNLKDNVHFLGYIDHSQLPCFYRTLDVFVIPSLQEGLGIAGLEAMACGCPVVSTRCGGVEDYVHESINGFLVDFTAKEMAEAICKIVGDRLLREKMSFAAINTVSSEYDQESMKHIFWDAFEQTFGQKREG